MDKHKLVRDYDAIIADVSINHDSLNYLSFIQTFNAKHKFISVNWIVKFFMKSGYNVGACYASQTN